LDLLDQSQIKLLKNFISNHINATDKAIEFASGVSKEDGTTRFSSVAQAGIPNIPYSSIGGKSFHLA
jgi:hypothetical protein